MKSQLTFLIVLLTFCLFLTNTSAQTKDFRNFELSDIGKLSTLTDPQISPDGQSILIVVSMPNFEENKNQNDIYQVDIATGGIKKITYNRPNVSHPRWSPSANRIAFIASDASQNTSNNQIFVISVDGGEAMKLTTSPTGVQQFCWSPDGNSIAFVQEDEPENKKEIEMGYDAFEIKNNSIFLNKKPRSSHIWLISSTGGEPKRLTSGNWSLPVSYPPGSPASPLSWSSDGGKIAFQCNESPYTGEIIRTIQTVDVRSGKIEAVTLGKAEGVNFVFESLPIFSPDGKYIAYFNTINGNSTGSEVFVIAGNEKNGKSVTGILDRCVRRAEWNFDSKSILAAANDNSTVSLWMIPLTGTPTKIDLGNLCISGAYWYEFNTGNDGSIALIASSSNSPQELYYLSSVDSTIKKLTEFNNEVKPMSFGKQETLVWKSDSYSPSGIITFPPDFDPTKKYPLVLRIHGGPDMSSKEYFNPETQSIASHGYVVFEPNYRGSDNMGKDFLLAIKNNQGEGPGKDIMEGIAELKKRPYIDSEKIAVSGWSYGGFLTTWLIGNYKGWKCAVAGAPVTELTDLYTQNDNGSIMKFFLGTGKSPFSDKTTKNLWIKQSTISYAENVTTPTLILSCTKDERVPITQSYNYFRALQDNGTESKFIVFPIGGHNPADPVRNRERYRLWLDWLDKYLK